MITLKTLDKASAQEVFDQVKTHLLTQNEVCILGVNCAYKSGNLKCAAGCLISDDEYKSEFERIGWRSLSKEFGVSDNHFLLIEDLQIVHDQEEVEDWPEELKRVAYKFNLVY